MLMFVVDMITGACVCVCVNEGERKCRDFFSPEVTAFSASVNFSNVSYSVFIYVCHVSVSMRV